MDSAGGLRYGGNAGRPHRRGPRADGPGKRDASRRRAGQPGPAARQHGHCAPRTARRHRQACHAAAPLLGRPAQGASRRAGAAARVCPGSLWDACRRHCGRLVAPPAAGGAGRCCGGRGRGAQPRRRTGGEEHRRRAQLRRGGDQPGRAAGAVHRWHRHRQHRSADLLPAGVFPGLHPPIVRLRGSAEQQTYSWKLPERQQQRGSHWQRLTGSQHGRPCRGGDGLPGCGARGGVLLGAVWQPGRNAHRHRAHGSARHRVP
mmetsp:Transcript_8741/g.22187  ORF Transcript_8741/g.22187 Transcript_8741/m.22187 type:complete len:260 (+) Transcript_8741:432-1211(+)